jgi:DNA-binding transcriptional ArsR family regulator
LDGKEMTAGEMAEKLQDIPQASLYRHINALLKEEEILTVVSENRIRGTLEKVFSLSATWKAPPQRNWRKPPGKTTSTIFSAS